MRIAIAGLGNVGAASVRLLRAQADLLALRGQAITVVAVSARDRAKNRDCDLTGIEWVDDPLALAAHAGIDVVVETMGGAHGIGFDLAKETLNNGKHLVTANKALIAAHGVELARLAEKNKLQLSFEAAVCGGIPVLKVLREGLAANRVTELRGILNGTCNYILTRMSDDNMEFAAALAEAQRLGYAEADPAGDIDGHDAANKLAILSAIAFGVKPDIASISVEGIRAITQADLQDAAARGGRIKLLGIASNSTGTVKRIVRPVFVPESEPLARVGGSGNMIEMTGDFAGISRAGGLGAGGDATASAVVADLVDIARGHRGCAFGIAAERLA